MEPRHKSRKNASTDSKSSATKHSSSVSQEPGCSSSHDGFLGPQQYHVFFRKARDAMFVADIRTRRIVDVNLSAVRLMGYSRKKLLTLKADDLHPPEVRAETMAGFKRYVAGSLEEVVSRVLTARGKQIPVGIRASRIELGEKTYLLGIFRNITKAHEESEKLRRSEIKSHVLSRASFTLLKVTDPLKRYHALLTHILKASGSQYGFIGYIDPETGFLVAPTMTEEIWDKCRMHRKDFVLREFKGLWGWVLTHREVVRTNDPGKDPRHSRQPRGHIRIRSFLGVPCISGGKTVGMIALANRAGGYTKTEEDLVRGYGKLVTVAILDHYRHMDKIRTGEALKRHRKLEHNLLEISRKLPLCKDLSEAWQAVCEPINLAIGAMASSLYIPNPEKTFFRVIDSGGWLRDPLPGSLPETEIPFEGKSIISQVCHTKKMISVRDTETDLRLRQGGDLTLVGGYRSLVAMPLVYEKVCFGVALFFFEPSKTFGREEIDPILLAVRQLSPALAKIDYDRKIQESENRFRALVEKNLSGVYLIQGDRFQYVNPRLAEIFGYTPEELIGKKGPMDLVDPDDRLVVEEDLRRGLAGGTGSVQHSFRGRKKGGESFFVDSICNWIDYRGRPAILGSLLDITARKRSEEAILQVARGISAEVGETFFRSIVEHLARILDADVAFIGELEPGHPGSVRTRAVFARGRIVDNFAYDLAGTPCENVVSKELRTYPSDVQKRFPTDHMLRDMGISAYAGIPLFNASGGALGHLVVLYRRPMENVALVESMLKIFASRTAAELEREQAEQALQDSQERLKVVFDSLDAIIYVTDIFSHEVLFLNRYAKEIFGEATGKLCWKVLQKNRKGPCDFCTNKKLLTPEGAPGEGIQWEFRNTINDRWYEIRDRAIRWIDGRLVRLEIAVDISDRKRLEEELARAQRLEAAGRVAGQIAHDFNNLLSPLMAYPDLIRMECKGDESMLPLLDTMQSVAMQMSEINQQLLTLGRRGHYNLSAVHLNRLMDGLLDSIPLPETVVVQKSYAADLLPVRGGKAQLNRVLLNLITNAVEAMTEIGTLSISAANLYLDEPLQGYETVERGEYVKVEIGDTGSGVDPEILENIFDPFFTTKRTDRKRGSGLGLSVVSAVMEDHHGYIGVENRPGQGSLFTLYFPIAREVEPEVSVADVAVPGGEERILVVDDDPVQREVLQHLLGQLGYEVHAVESGEQAVEHVRENPQDLLVLDMVMDGIDGTETFRRIRTFYPEQKAVILSGYAESNRVAGALRLGAGDFVHKPIDMATLARVVRKELDR